jgi:hypothetical protein
MARMTEKQAWLVIAEAYATNYKDRTYEQGYLSGNGICYAIHFCIAVGFDIQKCMNRKIEDCGGNRNKYFCPIRKYGDSSPKQTVKCDAWRADFCYLMYYSCEDGKNERI